jgi:hypothetical protein
MKLAELQSSAQLACDQNEQGEFRKYLMNREVVLSATDL